MPEAADASCEGLVVAVTGAGRGIGRAEALAFGRAGARVIVNNRSADAAHEVAEAIVADGGEAVAHSGDVSDIAVAAELVGEAVDRFGRLDALVNNAGVVRDRMLVNMSADEWDDVVRINLRGTFATTQAAARHWRDRAKLGPVAASIVNTTSSAGLYRNVGQANYGAAKAGVANLTIIASDELARYGVTVNAVAPVAATRMSEHLIPAERRAHAGFDPYDPANVAPLVIWLTTAAARGVTGRVFEVRGGRISIAEGWHAGPAIERDSRWTVDELSGPITQLHRAARANALITGQSDERDAT